MKLKKTLIFMVIISFAVLPVLAKHQGQRNWQDRGMKKFTRMNHSFAQYKLFPARMILKAKKEIALKDSQEKKIIDLSTANKAALIKKEADLKTANLNLKTYMMKGDVSKAKFASLIKNVYKVKTDMRIMRMNNLLDLKSVLTKEQIEKLDTLRKNFRRRGNRRDGRRGGMMREHMHQGQRPGNFR